MSLLNRDFEPCPLIINYECRAARVQAIDGVLAAANITIWAEWKEAGSGGTESRVLALGNTGNSGVGERKVPDTFLLSWVRPADSDSCILYNLLHRLLGQETAQENVSEQNVHWICLSLVWFYKCNQGNKHVGVVFLISICNWWKPRSEMSLLLLLDLIVMWKGNS